MTQIGGERSHGSGDRYVLNMGSWLKKLKRISSIFRFLPAVYYPSFQLNYFKILAEGDRLEIVYECMPKQARSNLTPLEKLAILGRRKPQPIAISHTTVVRQS